MFSEQLARFSVPDPAMMSASVQNPQTWNRYAYVLNSPLKYSDPLGLWAVKRVVHKKTDDKGNETDQIDYVEFILVAEEGDDLNTLKEQFNLKSEKDASKLMDSLMKNGMRLSKVSNSNIKNVFKEMESIEKNYQQAILDKGVEAANDNGRDCSMTTSQIRFGEMIRGTDAVKAFAEGDRPGIVRSERNPKDARTGDAILWVKNNEPVHLATFLIFNRSGEPVVYSKTNSTGPYEVKTTGNLTKDNPNFGKADKYYVGRP